MAPTKFQESIMIVNLKFAHSISNSEKEVDFTINFGFADDIILLAESDEQLADILTKLNK